jgi:hypothetical protein
MHTYRLLLITAPNATPSYLGAFTTDTVDAHEADKDAAYYAERQTPAGQQVRVIGTNADDYSYVAATVGTFARGY